MRRRPAWALLVAVVTSLVALLTAAPAAAHVRVDLQSPRDGARLQAVPETVEVALSEPVRLADVRVQVTDSAGVAVVDGVLGEPGELGSVGRLAVPPDAGPASYVVTVTAQGLDGHVILATFAFVVGEGPLVREQGAVAPDDGLVVVGAGWLGAMATVVGLVVFAAAALGLLRAAPGAAPLSGAVLALGPVCGLVGGVLQLTAARGARGVDSYAQVLSSQAGRVLVLRCVSWLLLLGALTWWNRDRGPRGGRQEAVRQNVVLGLSVPLLLSVAGSSHAASDGWALITLLASMTHVAAMATWFGGLVRLWVARREEPDWLGPARGFATVASVSAGLAVLTGVVLAARLTEGFAFSSLASGYGAVLGTKVALVLLLLMAALRTRNRVARAHLGAHAPGADDHRACASCRAAGLAVRREVAVATSVLLAGTFLSVLAV
ncbi:MAG: copper resistance protein CopC [Knoellia sp.]